ncbi:hypothetical protein NC652_005446 [Populus alba x Populus x berolinensis]|nr:hypothetical protein NC652_005446 [Populus alba x Populus x berolinensis]
MRLYREMLDEGTRQQLLYTIFTRVALSRQASLENCKFELSVEIFNCLIDGLCETGKLKTAWDLFYRMSNEGLKPTVVTYSIMIHGLCKEAKWKRQMICYWKWRTKVVLQIWSHLTHPCLVSYKIMRHKRNRRKGMLTTTVSLKICDIKYVLNILPTTVSFCVQVCMSFVSS